MLKFGFDRHRDVHVAGEKSHQAINLYRSDDLVGHENRPNARVGEDFRLTKLRDGDADRPRVPAASGATRGFFGVLKCGADGRGLVS